MVFYENALFWPFLLHKNLYSKKQKQNPFLQKLTQFGSMIEEHIKAKNELVADLTFQLQCKNTWFAVSLDINVDVVHGSVNVTKLFEPRISYRFFIGSQHKLSRTSIRHDCHRRKSAGEGKGSTFSVSLAKSFLTNPFPLI